MWSDEPDADEQEEQVREEIVLEPSPDDPVAMAMEQAYKKEQRELKLLQQRTHRDMKTRVHSFGTPENVAGSLEEGARSLVEAHTPLVLFVSERGQPAPQIALMWARALLQTQVRAFACGLSPAADAAVDKQAVQACKEVGMDEQVVLDDVAAYRVRSLAAFRAGFGPSPPRVALIVHFCSSSAAAAAADSPASTSSKVSSDASGSSSGPAAASAAEADSAGPAAADPKGPSSNSGKDGKQAQQPPTAASSSSSPASSSAQAALTELSDHVLPHVCEDGSRSAAQYVALVKEIKELVAGLPDLLSVL